MVSREHRVFLIGRARAEARLRLFRVLGSNISGGNGTFFPEGSPLIRAPGQLALGEECRLRGGPVRSRFITGPHGRIELGSRIGINYGAEFFAEQSIAIGDDSIFGALVTIYDTNFHPVEQGEETKVVPVEIGTNVWVGRGVMIFPGARIGDHSVIASGSIVTSEIPPRVLAAGSPARAIRELRADEGWRRV